MMEPVPDPISVWMRVRKEFKDYTPIRTAIKVTFDSVSNIRVPTVKTRIPVTVKRIDTLAAALQEKNPLVLIFADAYNPGGCMWAGAGMQEESLFRRTALFKHLTTDMYPLKDDEAIYAPDVQLSESMNFMSFVACAAPKMPPMGPDGRLLPEDEDLFRKKIELVFDIAIKHGHRSIVLGAWGAGAFGCPPKHVAEIFRKVIDELHEGAFNRIVFAVLGGNYHFFEGM